MADKVKKSIAWERRGMDTLLRLIENDKPIGWGVVSMKPYNEAGGFSVEWKIGGWDCPVKYREAKEALNSAELTKAEACDDIAELFPDDEEE